jgi:O-antigen ligase
MAGSFMTPSTRIRRRRSSSGQVAGKASRSSGGLAALVTAFLLVVILMAGPLVLGATPLWIELPLLDVAALLCVVQGLRLTAKPPENARLRIDAIDLSVLVFVLYAVVRWLTSPAEYPSRIEVMGIVAYAGVFFTCRYGMANRKYGMALLYALVVLGGSETFLGYYINDHPDWYPFGLAEGLNPNAVSRWMGTYESPNHYASLLVMAMGAALALGSFSKLPWPARIILFYVGVMMIVGVIYSGSRGSWIALVAAIGALVIRGIRNGTLRWWVPVTGALALVAVTLVLFTLSPVVPNRLASTPNPLAGDKLDTEPRVDIAAEALRMARDHPFFGTGPATFAFVHPHYQESRLDFQPERTHDDYLNCLDDYGLVGFGVAMFFVAAVTLKFFRPLDVDNRWQDRVLVATGFAAWLALMVHSLFDFNLHIPANALLFFSLTGLAVGRIRDESQAHWSQVSLAPLGRWLGWGIVLLSVAFGFLVARTALSDWAYEKAFLRADQIPLSDCVTAAEEALRYEPLNVQALEFLGDSHRNLASLQKNRDERLAEGRKALDAYERALQANALDDSVEARIGRTLDIMQDYPEALPHYQVAVAAQPHNGLYWYWLSTHYLENDELKLADEAYLRVRHCFHPREWNVAWEKQRAAVPGPGNGSKPPPPASR